MYFCIFFLNFCCSSCNRFCKGMGLQASERTKDESIAVTATFTATISTKLKGQETKQILEQTAACATATALASANSAVTTALTRRQRIRKLLHFHELEEWRKDNEWIWTGYRVSDNTYISCIESLLFIHNESGNIYSHLFGALFFACLAVYTFTYVVKQTLFDQLVFVAFFFGVIFCLTFSGLFHTLCSHSHTHTLSVSLS